MVLPGLISARRVGDTVRDDDLLNLVAKGLLDDLAELLVLLLLLPRVLLSLGLLELKILL